MNKNGKNIKCKVCKKGFYISGSRIGFRRYCSRECAKKDDYGFKPRTKNCSECGEKFVISLSIRSGDKTCSTECRYNAQIRRAKEQSERKKKMIVKKICRECGKEVVSSLYCPKNFCDNNFECYKKFLSKRRKGKDNPAYRNGLSMKGKNTYNSKHLRACAKYRKEFLKNNDYLFCEVCGVNKNGTARFEVHHIYYASLYPKHPELHNFRNLILICIRCHNDFHSGKMRSEEFLTLEKERGLKELFKSR